MSGRPRKYDPQPPVEKVGYKYEPQCMVCTVQDTETGELLRDQIERMYYKNRNLNEIQELLEKRAGIRQDKSNISRHFRKHAPYVYESEGLDKAKQFLAEVVTDKVKTETVLDEIISRGFNNIKTGKIPITDRLLIGALKLKKDLEKSGQLGEFMETLYGGWLKHSAQNKVRKSDLIDGEIDTNNQTEDSSVTKEEDKDDQTGGSAAGS